MKCVICKQANTQPGFATVTLERGGLTLVVKHVPAQVCSNCGEEYVDEQAAAQLVELAERSERFGVQVDVREYAVA